MGGGGGLGEKYKVPSPKKRIFFVGGGTLFFPPNNLPPPEKFLFFGGGSCVRPRLDIDLRHLRKQIHIVIKKFFIYFKKHINESTNLNLFILKLQIQSAIPLRPLNNKK